MTALSQLAMDKVGLEDSPFFVTLLTNTEFDGGAFTIAAFASLMDAVTFASMLRLNANESLVVEGPQGIYVDTAERSLPSLGTIDARTLANIN